MTNRVEILENVLGELYQVLGELVALAKICIEENL